MHISKPPHYRQQESCLGTRTTRECVCCVCVHLCLRVWVCVLVARALFSPNSFQDLVNRVGSRDHIATECAVAWASVSFSGTHAVVLLPWKHRGTHAFLHMCAHTHTLLNGRETKLEWERGKNEKVPIKLLRQTCQQSSGGWRRKVYLCVFVLERGG